MPGSRLLSSAGMHGHGCGAPLGGWFRTHEGVTHYRALPCCFNPCPRKHKAGRLSPAPTLRTAGLCVAANVSSRIPWRFVSFVSTLRLPLRFQLSTFHILAFAHRPSHQPPIPVRRRPGIAYFTEADCLNNPMFILTHAERSCVDTRNAEIESQRAASSSPAPARHSAPRPHSRGRRQTASPAPRNQ